MPITGWILVYAFLVAGGGLMGYLKAKSTVSLISGLGSGAALVLAWLLTLQSPTLGLALAAAVALALAIFFAGRFRKTRAWMPTGLMMLLSTAAAIGFALACLPR